MLRLKAATSKASDFTNGYFQPVITDNTVDPAGVRRVLLCAGKITWDLFSGRQKAGPRRRDRATGTALPASG